MFKQHKDLLAAFVLLVGLGVYGYSAFSNYKPKGLVQLGEVRGDKSDKSNSLDLPYPDKADRISISKTSSGEQVTFKTLKNKNEVQEYYKNVLATLNWKLESEAIYDSSTISRFYKDDTKVSVMAFDEENQEGALVGIEITSH